VPMIVIAAVLAVVGVLVQARQLEPATT